MSTAEKKPIYYGWKIVFAIMVQLTFNSGLSFYNNAIYLDALAAKPAFDVQSASFAVSIFFLTGGITGLFVARRVQVMDPRFVISAGAIIASLALSALPFVATLWQLYLAYALFGVGFSASGLIPATTLVTRWFRRRRAMALSIASTGLSLGGVVLTPFCVLLVERLSFEIAAPIMGLMFIVGVIPVALIWLRSDPAAMGLGIDGDVVAEQDSNGASGAPEAQELGVTFSDALRGRFFWAVSLAYIFLMMAQVGGIAHQYGLAREQLDEAQTALVVAILPVASIIGRLIGGWLVDRVSIRVFAIAMMILQALSLIMLAGGFNVVTLCLGLFLFGTTVGNLLMLQPLLVAEAFGVKDYAKIFSVSNLMSSLGTSGGPALLGVVYTLSNNFYAWPYVAAAVAGALGLCLFLTGGRVEHAQVRVAEKEV